MPSLSNRGLMMRVSMAGIALGAWLITGHTWAADIPSGYLGGWVTGSDDCSDIFTSRAGRLSYRKPINAFAPAILVTPRQIATPTTRCTVLGVAQVDDRTQVRLSCATPVAVDTTQALFRLEPDGTLKRFLNATDTRGSTYRRCPLGQSQ
jgi:hypothetical protein